MGAKIAFVVASGGLRGTGHVVRAVNTIRAVDAGRGPLQGALLVGEIAPTLRPALAREGIRFRHTGLPSTRGPIAAKAIERALAAFGPQLVVLDLLHSSGLSPGRMKAALGAMVAAIDDFSPSSKGADIVVDVFHPRRSAKWRAAFAGRYAQGLRYMALDPRLTLRAARLDARPKNAFLSFGGTDPWHIGARMSALVNEWASGGWNVTWVKPPKSGRRPRRGGPRINAVNDRPPFQSLLPLMAQSRFAVVSGGLTVCEAVAAGTPTVFVYGPTYHQRALARELMRRRALVGALQAADLSHARGQQHLRRHARAAAGTTGFAPSEIGRQIARGANNLAAFLLDSI